MSKLLLKVRSNEEIADKIYKLELLGDYDLNEFLPGKFLHIKCDEGWDPLLRRPMSICDIDDAGEVLTVLYRKEGKGTAALAVKHPGDVIDVLAPLGVHFPTEQVKLGQRILMVGGGIGVPPLYYLARKLKAQGAIIKSILGFNSAKDVFYEQEFSALGEVAISTIDGSHGHKGLVTDLMDDNWDLLYSCGPTPMLKAVQNLVPKDKEAYVSLEERMGCGLGACLACVCETTSEGYSRICTEGPVFAVEDHKLALI